MTALTPEQLRALAELGPAMETGEYYNVDSWIQDATAALRAAADQLEAASALVADVGAQRDYWADRLAAVERVTDRAEDDEDGNGWVPVDPLLDALYPEKRGVSNV